MHKHFSDMQANRQIDILNIHALYIDGHGHKPSNSEFKKKKNSTK